MNFARRILPQLRARYAKLVGRALVLVSALPVALNRLKARAPDAGRPRSTSAVPLVSGLESHLDGCGRSASCSSLARSISTMRRIYVSASRPVLSIV